MRNVIAACTVVVLLAAVAWLGLSRMQSAWHGVDEAVVEKFAREAGRPPREPFINTDRGDLLLFVFLLAGTAGGFVGGYYFRELFPKKDRTSPINH